ncbi:tripartite tricarboxylate transporter substrate binding protein [Roseomonas aerophila]|uniref:Tripartite tricarboxylate transporter substrate binding protein n=1 Tax=Teichococcus aerophilus TaxID=1224513 RepID=A0ABR7RNX5_9PROT|nr:tripartite tricarboxylate transporter substrate binding protein [Pseudoroseomonas aerophila]MBC9208310.1 tripartite tricarboxylate transporter substrate binding protein [Pseudoroseomonas aerophila]
MPMNLRSPSRLRRRSILAAGIGLAIARPARAQGFPNQPVRLIVPFSPGGAVDFVGRLVGQGMGPHLGQSVVVENRTGAAGAIGAQFVARAPADGHTLMMAPITNFAMLAGMPGNNLGLDLGRDFAPVGTIGAVPIVVVAGAGVRASSLAELIALLRKADRPLSYASSGNGSTEHLAGEYFATLTGTRMLHVPYRGGAPALADVLAGQVDLMFATLPNVMQNGSGLKVLAIATGTRSSVMPDVPTTAEAGLPGFQVSSLYGVLAPAATPGPVLARLNRDLRAALAQDDVRNRLIQQGVLPEPTTPEATAAQLREELSRWGKVIVEAKVTLN